MACRRVASVILLVLLATSILPVVLPLNLMVVWTGKAEEGPTAQAGSGVLDILPERDEQAIMPPPPTLMNEGLVVPPDWPPHMPEPEELMGLENLRSPEHGLVMEPGEPKPLTPGPDDWIVTGEEIHENETIILTGNLIVQPGGNLTLINCTLLMNCSYDGEWQILVNSSGVLNVLRDSNITAYNPEYEFLFYVYGRLFMQDSFLSRCGYDSYHPGLWLETDEGVMIKNCTITRCNTAIRSIYSLNITITDCKISQNDRYGILLSRSANITITNCIISYNYYGILCQWSSNITVRDNVFIHDGLVFWGTDLHHYASHTVENNTVNGKPLYYITDLSGYVIPSETGQVIIVNSSNIHVNSLSISNTDIAVQIAFSDRIYLNDSSFYENVYGIRCYHSNITANSCLIEENEDGGMGVYAGSTVFLNNCYIRYNLDFGVWCYSSVIKGSSCLIRFNWGSMSFGGGVLLADSLIYGCSIEWNWPLGVCCRWYACNVINSCIIEGSHKGISCVSSNATINNCYIRSCTFGISAKCFSHVTAVNCSISKNYYRGIMCHYSDATLINCVINENKEAGFYFAYGVGILDRCIISKNGGWRGHGWEGVFAGCSTTLIVNACYITENKGIGIRCNNAVIISSCISKNNGTGILCSGSLLMRYCVISSNRGHGLYYTGSQVANATYCWWGSSYGPEYKEEGDPYDPEEVWGNITYEPWIKFKISPSYGELGTIVETRGECFPPGDVVLIYANRTLMASCVVEDDGTFEVEFPMLTNMTPGLYIINATTESGVPWATATFHLYDFMPLDLSVDVGTIHFRGEIAEFYILTSHHGRPVNITSLNATLYWPNGTITALSWIQIGTGFYKATFNIPVEAPTGTYTLLAEARLKTSHIDAWGSDIRSFLLSPTLTEWNARLIAIENDTAIIRTDIGVIKMNLTEIEAEIEGIQGDLIVIKSDVGTILAKLDALNATLVAVQGDVLEIQTALGELEVKIDDVNATLVDVLDYCVLINTTLGELKARLEAINATLTDLIVDAEGNIIAEIQTALGEIEAHINELNATLTGLIITSKNDLMALIETKAGEIIAKLEAVNATIIDVFSDEMGYYYALLNTTLGEVEVKLDTIKNWLTRVNATLIEIREDVAVIKAGSDTILTRLDAINATIAGIEEDVVVIKSCVGTILAKLDALNATLTAIQGDIMEIQTALGELEVRIDDVNATIVDVLDYCILINTTLGELEAKLDTVKSWLAQMNATIVAIQGDIAVLKANTTTILAKLDTLNATLTGLIKNAKGEVLAQIQTVLGNLTAKLVALNATIVALRDDVAVINTTLGQVEATLEILNATITLVEGNIVEIRTILGTIQGNITDIKGHLATIETDIGEIKAILAEWTGATTSIAGYKVMVLTTSELRDLRAEGTTIVISLYAPEDGRLHVLIPKDLLAKLGVSLDAVDVVLDRLETRYDAVDLGSCYMLVVSCGPGDHTIKIYLTGAPIYEKPEGLIAIGSGATIAIIGVAAWLIRRKFRRP
ncbi:MAG: hypothetical protein DRN06_04920 [Thermoprotei archaeon]|nr:MAG: hypothetical protein DRN06_04920 [Thermoprotei archaeon]